VIEREAGWGIAGTGMYLPANGVRALRTLGLEGAVAARGTRIPRQRLLDHRGNLLADIDLDQLWGDVGPCLALPRADLHQILRDGVPVQLCRTIRSLEHLDGPVQVGFDDGSASEFDLVVGADGLRSSVRRLAVDPRPPVQVGQHSWRFLDRPHRPRRARGARRPAGRWHNHAFETLSVCLGLELRLYQALNDLGTATEAEIAAATGVALHYAASGSRPSPAMLPATIPGTPPRSAATRWRGAWVVPSVRAASQALAAGSVE
jgi:2-polyprenyl-6-methoxyphenol hydroxylase-like FAD-dependent oxidoreductase